MKSILYKSFGLFVLLFLTLANCDAQSFSYKNKKFEWPVQKPDAINVEPLFANQDAVVLEEETELFILDDKMGKMYNDNRMAKHERIKFLTEKGIAEFSKIILPESYDPSMDYRSLEVCKWIPFIGQNAILRE